MIEWQLSDLTLTSYKQTGQLVPIPVHPADSESESDEVELSNCEMSLHWPHNRQRRDTLYIGDETVDNFVITIYVLKFSCFCVIV